MKKILYTTIMLLMLAACNTKEEFIPMLDLNESAYSVPVAGQDYTFTINSNVHWTISTTYAEAPEQPWVSLSETSGNGNGNVTITIKANESMQSRTATLSVIGTEVPEKVITITQLGVAPSITIAGDAMQNVGVATGTLKLNVTTNMPAKDLQLAITTTDNIEWLTIKDREQLSGGAGYDYYFEYSQNMGLASREAEIKIYSGEIAGTVKVIQEGEAKIVKIVSFNGPDSLSGYGESFSVTVSTNVEVSASIADDGGWLTLVEGANPAPAKGPARVIGNKTFNFMANANTPDGSRKTKLTFYETGNTALFDTITVVQKVGGASMLEIAGTNIVGGMVPAVNGTFTVTLNTNVGSDIDVAASEGWIIPMGNTGLVYKFNTLVNEGYPSRNGTITFKHRWSDLSATIKITQGGQEGSRYTDSLALIALYNAMDGPHWVNPWQLDKPITSGGTIWRGVTTVDGRVTKITLASRGLKGTIPAEFYNLPKLTNLVVSESGITGGFGGEAMKNLASLGIIQFQNAKSYTLSLPKELGDLPLLTSIELNGNAFTGTIPKEWAKLSNLTNINLLGNQLTGTIPEEIYDMASLTFLNLGSNKLEGYISPKIGQLTKMTFFSVDANRLEGEIPEEVGRLINCTSFYFSNNNFTGNLPESLKNLGLSHQYPYFVVVWAHNNRLSGAIPDALKSHPGFNKWVLCNQQATYGLTNIEGSAACQ